MEQHEKHSLKKLIEWTDNPVPDFFRDLSNRQQGELHSYVKEVVDYETDGLDDLYQGMSQTMKYLPTFILVKMSVKFVKPAISAGVTAKMALKDAIKLTPQFPIDYACEVGNHLDSRLAAKIYSGLKPDRMGKLLEYMIENHPAKALNIGQHLDDKFLKRIASFSHLLDIEAMDPFLVEEYQGVIEKIESFA
jgi:hypothetical protein